MESIRNILDTIVFAFSTVVFFLLGYRLKWTKTLEDEDEEEEHKPSIHPIPGPTALPILGTTWLFLVGGWKFNKLHIFSRYLYLKYGPVVKEETLFNVPIINVFEREDIEKVLKCHSKYPIRPPIEALANYRRSRPDRYDSVGLVNEQGETWHFLRQSLTQDLMSPRTISGFLPQVEEIASDWCDLLKSQINKDGNIMNVEELAGRLGLEVSCALVLGRRMGFLLPEGETEIARKFADAVQNYFIATRDTYFGLPFWKLFPTSTYNSLVKNEETIYDLALELIETADDSTRESAVFQSVLRANISEKEKTAAIIDFIAAGIHTLKNSLLFLLHSVASNPRIQDKIVEDSSKTYTKACMFECFRYLPTAFALARISEQELELGGYKIEAGSVLICHTGIACRDEKNFENPDEFRPERWINEEKAETVAKSTYIVTPFGAGRRICPGKRFIEQVLPIFLEHTVNRFQMTTNHPLELEFEFLLSPKAPVAIHFQERY